MTTLVPTEMHSRRPLSLGISIPMLIAVVGSFVSMMMHFALPSLASVTVVVYFVVQKVLSGLLVSLETANYAGSAISGKPFGTECSDIVLVSFVAVLAALTLSVAYFLRTVKSDTTSIERAHRNPLTR